MREVNKFRFLSLDDLEERPKYFAEKKERAEKVALKAEWHTQHMFYAACDVIDSNSRCLLPANHPKYTPPTPEQIRAVVDLLRSRGYSKRYIAERLGVSPMNNQVINRWLSGERSIFYSVWIHLATLAGLVLPVMMEAGKNMFDYDEAFLINEDY